MNNILQDIATADLIKELESRKKKAMNEAVTELNAAITKLKETCIRAYDIDNPEYYIECFFIENGEVYFRVVSE